MVSRRSRSGGSLGDERRVKASSRNAKRPDSEMIARAELKIMREIVVVLVQAINDLFDCIPKDSYATEKIKRIEATLGKVQKALVERRQHWETENDKGTGLT
jgi:hypothetical protein